MKHIRASGSACFIMRAVNTMGVMVMEIFLARAGKAVLAIMLQAGQQEVAIKSSFSGTSSRKSFGFLHSAQVSANGDLDNVAEAHSPQSGLQLLPAAASWGTG